MKQYPPLIALERALFPAGATLAECQSIARAHNLRIVHHARAIVAVRIH